mgnify:CR=1 FL=1
MSKVSVTYRAVGSAALKPEYTFKQNASTPIISFDRLAYSSPHRKLPLKTRLNIFKKVAIAIYTDPLFGSIDKAFLKPGTVSKTSSETYIRSVAGASLVMLVLILVGA